MDKLLQSELYSEYPDLYAEKDCSIQESCMPWGMETGMGWYFIIKNLSAAITRISKDVRATQVKEKFGGLRFYWRSTEGLSEKQYELVSKAVDAAEEESYLVCEDCGSREMVEQSLGWIRTECGLCRLKRKLGVER